MYKILRVKFNFSFNNIKKTVELKINLNIMMAYWKFLKTFKQNDGSIKSYNDMTSAEINSVGVIPYFAGDFWPNKIKTLIEEHEKKCKSKNKSENRNNLVDVNKILKKVQLYYNKYGKVNHLYFKLLCSRKVII